MTRIPQLIKNNREIQQHDTAVQKLLNYHPHVADDPVYQRVSGLSLQLD